MSNKLPLPVLVRQVNISMFANTVFGVRSAPHIARARVCVYVCVCERGEQRGDRKGQIPQSSITNRARLFKTNDVVS